MALHLARFRRSGTPSHPYFQAPDRIQISATKDGTVTAASTPSTTPASRQTAQSLHTYISNKSAQTGSSPQTKSTGTPYKYAAPPAPLSLPQTVLKGRGFLPRPFLERQRLSVCGVTRRRRWDRLQSVFFRRVAFDVCYHRSTQTLLINRTKSAVNASNFARATLLFG